MKFKRIAAVTLTGALLGSLCTGAFADENVVKSTQLKLTIAEPYDSDYVMTIPADFTITSNGFNALSGLKVAHNPVKTETTFDPNKKVTVTATSGNEWQLKATGVAEGIGYQLKGSAEDNAATTSWEFTGDKITNDGETKAVGVDVENYDDAAPGDYTDTITFTAKVESTAVAVTGITLNKTETSIQVGNNETLSVTAITPDDATDKTYTWSSDKESVATVDADGKVTAVAAGTAHIRATANDGSGIYGECTVTVNSLPLYYDKAVQVYQRDDPNYRDYLYASNYKTLSAEEGYALAKYFASVNNCSVAVITDWNGDSGQIKYVTNASSSVQEDVPMIFMLYDRIYLVPNN